MLTPGMLAVVEAARLAFRPEPDLPVWQWAEREVVLPALESPEYAGPYRTEMTPFVREILEWYRDDDVRQVSLPWSTQVSKTLLEMIGAMWWLTHREGRLLWMLHTEEVARSFSLTRWQPTVDACAALRALKPRDADLFKNMEQRFGGSVLNFVGGNSPGSAVTRPADLVNLDECDLYLGETESTASVITMVGDRTKSRSGAKQFRVSSPTVESGAVWVGYLEGDQRRYFVPCPRCGEMQVLDPANIRWSQRAEMAGGQWDYARVRATAVYECPTCSGTWPEALKRDAVHAGQWRPTNPHPYPGCRSAQLGSIYSLWPATALGELAVQFLRHKARFDLRAWDNSWRGMPHSVAGERVEAGEFAGRLAEYDAEIPAQVVGLTAGVDTQDDRLEAELVGWAPGEVTYSIDYRVFWGDPAEAPVWEALDTWLQAPRRLAVDAAFVDMGGHRSDAVLQFCRRREGRRVYACKGSSTRWAPIIASRKPSRNNKRRAAVWLVGTDTAKALLLSRFKVDEGAGACWWPANPDGTARYAPEYFEQLAGEELRTRMVKGREVRFFHALRARVEALDARVYATAARHILAPNLWELRHAAGYGAHEDPEPVDVPEPKARRSRRRGKARGWASQI